MDRTLLTDDMWRRFCSATGVSHETYDVVAFGRATQSEAKLAQLVIAGRKRATVNLMRNYEAGEPLPVIGGYVVTVDGDGNPICIWQTIELRLGPLNSVDEQFAYDEGEGDQTCEWWLAAHCQEFAAEAATRGYEFDDTMEAVFERFRVVWPPEVAD